MAASPAARAAGARAGRRGHAACSWWPAEAPPWAGSRRVQGHAPDGGQWDTQQYSMFFFLPDTRDGLSTMVDMVTSSPAYLYGILAEMKERPASIKLPKFAITFSWGDLKGDLSRLGLSLPFSPEAADLSSMCKGDNGDQVVTGAARGPTFLSKVAHTAVVKMDEVGTEAACVRIAGEN
ncbi:putative serpin-Z5 [Miscanthus floridulus]|uniref:putative serpin-Z5 n=1 Tax=Miscanthus floridulus TaxID=154761 RepID=UPI003459F68C